MSAATTTPAFVPPKSKSSAHRKCCPCNWSDACCRLNTFFTSQKHPLGGYVNLKYDPKSCNFMNMWTACINLLYISQSVQDSLKQQYEIWEAGPKNKSAPRIHICKFHFPRELVMKDKTKVDWLTPLTKEEAETMACYKNRSIPLEMDVVLKFVPSLGTGQSKRMQKINAGKLQIRKAPFATLQEVTEYAAVVQHAAKVREEEKCATEACAILLDMSDSNNHAATSTTAHEESIVSDEPAQIDRSDVEIKNVTDSNNHGTAAVNEESNISDKPQKNDDDDEIKGIEALIEEMDQDTPMNADEQSSQNNCNGDETNNGETALAQSENNANKAAEPPLDPDTILRKKGIHPQTKLEIWSCSCSRPKECREIMWRYATLDAKHMFPYFRLPIYPKKNIDSKLSQHRIQCREVACRYLYGWAHNPDVVRGFTGGKGMIALHHYPPAIRPYVRASMHGRMGVSKDEGTEQKKLFRWRVPFEVGRECGLGFRDLCKTPDVDGNVGNTYMIAPTVTFAQSYLEIEEAEKQHAQSLPQTNASNNPVPTAASASTNQQTPMEKTPKEKKLDRITREIEANPRSGALRIMDLEEQIRGLKMFIDNINKSRESRAEEV